MGVDYVVTPVFYQFMKLPERKDVREWVDAAAHFGHDDQVTLLTCLGQQFALAPAVDAARERDFVLRHSVEANDGEQGILLRAADDHPRNDMQDADGLSLFFCSLIRFANNE